MRILLEPHRRLVLLCLVCAARTAWGCDLPAGQSLWIRLTAPVSTYSAKRGDAVHAVLTQDLVCENEVVLSMGTPIEGEVRSKRKVGFGIAHETAALELEFNRAVTGADETVALNARVEEVQNAREAVRKGVIQGVLSTDTFQGRINSRLIHLPTWNPYSDPGLIAYKVLFPIFPEPEIYYAAGTDMHLRTTSEISSSPVIASGEGEPSPEATTEADDQLVEQLPWRVTTKKNVDADLLNLVFLGSEDEVRSAFREAGWNNADPSGRHAMLKSFYALLNNSGYAQQPMTTFLLNGEPEDMNWQKSLNSYDRRDHLRIWRWTPDGSSDSVWISSSTHDTRAVLAVKYKGFVHHISADIDDERSTVIRDLRFAGCVKSVSYISRPEIPIFIHNATGDAMRTDGSIAVIALQECHPVDPVDLQLDATMKGRSFKPSNYAFRFIRRQILTFRNDIFRANIIYGAYYAGRMTVLALRRSPETP